MDDKEIVAALRANLVGRLGQERFDLWLGSHARLTLRGDTLLVELPSRFSQDWVRSHFRREIEAAAAEIWGRSLALEFRVDEGLNRPHRAGPGGAGSAGAPAADTPAADPQVAGTGAAGTRADPPIDRPGLPAPRPVLRLAGGAPGKSAGDPPTARRPFGCLELFEVGQSNRLAHASARMVAEQPGRFSPLFLHGPTGVGKTHLLEGIWTAIHRHHPRIHAVYLSAEQFTTYYVAALHGSGLPNFRRKYRGVELLLIDDVQFFAGKRATVGELLFTIDTLLRQGSQIVLSADRAPTALREMNDGLTAPLAAGITCGIDPPDYQTRLGILRQLAAKMACHLTDDVAEFIATHLTSHARELAGALNRLEAASRIWQQPISRALAEESLAEMIRHNAPRRPLDRHRQSRMRRVRPRAGRLAIRPPREDRQPAADARDVAGSKAYAGRVDGDRAALRPPQPQHGDLGSKDRHRLGGQAVADRVDRQDLECRGSDSPRGRATPHRLKPARPFQAQGAIPSCFLALLAVRTPQRLRAQRLTAQWFRARGGLRNL